MAETGKSIDNRDDLLSILKERLGSKAEYNHPLNTLNTFGTGGPAKLYTEAGTVEELSLAVKIAREFGVPFFILGGGSNILVSDGGYNGLVIKNSVLGLGQSGINIISGAGEQLQSLVNFAAGNSLSGLEFASGIWGTVGGAIYGNAGAYGAEIGAVLKSAQLVDREGNIRTEEASYFQFSYRHSRLKETGEFVAKAEFALKEGNRDTIQGKMDEILSARKDKLPTDQRSAGCFFKNIIDKREKYGKISAGRLLDEAGAKAIKIGGAAVFRNHANIIINEGSAKSKDIKELAEILKRRVKEKFGILLEEEITYLGDFS
jgi:UDP-N-acetylmuramate dehydrogenase